MKIEKTPINSKIADIAPAPVALAESSLKAMLECGHHQYLDKIDGKVINVITGCLYRGKWEKWSGDEVKIGDAIRCHECTAAAYRARLAARPAEKAERFSSLEELRAAHPNAKWHEAGPVHKHGDRFFVITYRGQHEWLAFNVDDLREVYRDPGWEGNKYGFAFVPEEHAEYVGFSGCGSELDPPERPGKPITSDMLMLAEPDKLREYLEPGDPLRKEMELDK